MNKRLISVLMIAVMSIMLSACGGEASGALVGSWKGTGEQDGKQYSYLIEINSDNSYEKTVKENGNTISTESGIVEVNGNKVVLKKDGEDLETTSYDYSDGKLSNHGNVYTKE